MGFKLQVSGLVLATALLRVTGAQKPDAPGSGALELRIHPDRVEQGVPQGFTVVLVNKTNHDLRVPIPTIQCEDSFNGDILLRLRFRPLKAQPAEGQQGCANDNEIWPPILERIQNWKIVHSGDTLTVNAIVNTCSMIAASPARTSSGPCMLLHPSTLPIKRSCRHPASTFLTND
jgi:hypothetical protein